MPIKTIAFDCDGVILDSVQLKTDAFARLARPYGKEAEDRMVLYHSMHGGVSRYLKFEWFFREVLHRDISKKEKEEWGEKFRLYSLEAVKNCPLIPGALETLQEWHQKIPLYVCTGAPEGEVRMILEERGLAGYFRGIFGSPPKKAEVLEKIVNKMAKVLPEETLMVGDAGTDLRAAEKVETRFYGIGPELRGGNYPWSMDLVPLNGWIKNNWHD